MLAASPSGTDAASPARPAAAVFGCAGPALTDAERAVFRSADPLGFILFRRNCETADQVRRLVGDLRDTVGRDAPVLIDQEGGRVTRLKAPAWIEPPAAGRIGALHGRYPRSGLAAAWRHGRLLAALQAPLGIDVDCAPVADVPVEGAHDVIGDRAFGREPDAVAALARAQAEGLLAGGVLPVVKHIPGHGRARADSHKELPRVDAGRDVLEATDFAPFRALRDLPLGMVAHVVYAAIDPDRPSSTSPVVVGDVIRGWIGFDGLLFSDDIGMEALSGTAADRALAVLNGGCDVALHCSGRLAEIEAVAAAVPRMSDAAVARWGRAAAMKRSADSADPTELAAALDAMLATGVA